MRRSRCRRTVNAGAGRAVVTEEAARRSTRADAGSTPIAVPGPPANAPAGGGISATEKPFARSAITAGRPVERERAVDGGAGRQPDQSITQPAAAPNAEAVNVQQRSGRNEPDDVISGTNKIRPSGPTDRGAIRGIYCHRA
jgi:hypothetical protein